jgi:hypothetical protein
VCVLCLELLLMLLRMPNERVAKAGLFTKSHSIYWLQ